MQKAPVPGATPLRNLAHWDGLMRAALTGDETAYRTLLGELAAAVRAIVRAALSRGGRGDRDVEDIVQETLLAVHLKRHMWDAGQPFAPWAKAIARHKMIDALRRERIHAPIDDLIETLPAPESADETRGDVARLMARLGERARRIVHAVSIEGRATKDVAIELDMTDGAVRIALHRALKELARLYRTETKT